MAEATNLQDARERAANLLHKFEAAVTEKTSTQGQVAKDNANLQVQVQALARDNTILKRAVAIQNARQQVRTLHLHATMPKWVVINLKICVWNCVVVARRTASSIQQVGSDSVLVSHLRLLSQEYANREQEVAQLQQTIVQYQEQLRNAELHNYALSMHLRQATSSGPDNSYNSRNPDIC